jgi:selenocysteine-specific elongation factor
VSFVVGTAGHIDHGKSTLITAVTGIDPDRLEEEKRRGMTIDLGFAHMTLPSGREIGFVDMPGHTRFMRNMLAGTHGLDAALLVVAADEGVMPQTREHLDVLDLLDVRRGIAVLTKLDLVEPDWLELVRQEVLKTLAGTSLEGASVAAVSAVTGEGMAELIEALDRLLDRAPSRTDAGRPRLPVDRVFTMGGFGTVVTGTLVDGSLRAGQEMEILPSGRTVRIRGLQRHNTKADVVEPGSRVAANLGGVEKSEIARGDVLVAPGTMRPTRRVDARMRVVASAAHPVRHGAELVLHTGTADVSCRVIALEDEQVAPGAEAWVQLYLEHPIAAANGDRFVLRVPSPPATVAGGVIVDVAPRRHVRHDSGLAESLARRATGDVLQEELRKYTRGVTVAALLKATVAPPGDLERLQARRTGDWIFSEEAWRSIAARAGGELAAYHAAHPLRPGMAREELRSRLGVSSNAFAAVVEGLAEDGLLVERNGTLAVPDHEVALSTDGGPAAELLRLLGQNPFAPPSLAEAARQSGARDELIRALAQRGNIVRLSDDVAFTREAYESAVAMVKEIVAANGSVTVAELRDRMGASRRPVLALLEHLDAQRVTRRVGDARTLR